MRFMVLVKDDKNSEAGVLPDKKLLAEMGKFNEEMAQAGVMLAGEGLHPSSKGARVRFSGDKRIVIDGPFAETKELVAGFWLIQVRSKEEAIEWIKRCPNPMPGTESEIEIRQVYEADDFGDVLTPELDGRLAECLRQPFQHERAQLWATILIQAHDGRPPREQAAERHALPALVAEFQPERDRLAQPLLEGHLA